MLLLKNRINKTKKRHAGRLIFAFCNVFCVQFFITVQKVFVKVVVVKTDVAHLQHGVGKHIAYVFLRLFRQKLFHRVVGVHQCLCFHPACNCYACCKRPNKRLVFGKFTQNGKIHQIVGVCYANEQFSVVMQSHQIFHKHLCHALVAQC